MRLVCRQRRAEDWMSYFIRFAYCCEILLRGLHFEMGLGADNHRMFLRSLEEMSNKQMRICKHLSAYFIKDGVLLGEQLVFLGAFHDMCVKRPRAIKIHIAKGVMHPELVGFTRLKMSLQLLMVLMKQATGHTHMVLLGGFKAMSQEPLSAFKMYVAHSIITLMFCSNGA